MNFFKSRNILPPSLAPDLVFWNLNLFQCRSPGVQARFENLPGDHETVAGNNEKGHLHK